MNIYWHTWTCVELRRIFLDKNELLCENFGDDDAEKNFSNQKRVSCDREAKKIWPVNKMGMRNSGRKWNWNPCLDCARFTQIKESRLWFSTRLLYWVRGVCMCVCTSTVHFLSKKSVCLWVAVYARSKDPLRVFMCFCHSSLQIHALNFRPRYSTTGLHSYLSWTKCKHLIWNFPN